MALGDYWTLVLSNATYLAPTVGDETEVFV